MREFASSTKKHCQLKERDFKMFRSLWKWKVQSTYAIGRKFFSDDKVFAAYIRLHRLKRDGYVQSIQIRDSEFAWTLTHKGFRQIFESLPFMSNEGFKSEYPYHDFLCSAFQLGEWLISPPEGARTFSEQQLRRIPEDNWPEWVPRTPDALQRNQKHRPDGYSLFKIGNDQVVAAFEVERSIKDADRYERVVNFYNQVSSITCILWLVESRNAVKSLERIFKRHGIEVWSRHHFILLEEFRAKGWMAQMNGGQFHGKTLGQLLGYNKVSNGLQTRSMCNTLCLLNTRKRPMKPNKSKTSPEPKNP